MGLYPDPIGFGKRKKSVTAQKLLKRKMVQAIVKKLKAEGKRVDRQAINKEVFDKVRRHHMPQRRKHLLVVKKGAK
ncbi:MAG: hypothetical protein PHI58_07080 [Candidatus Omnitrophica bacterium]|nr:hypothetical protein [Candidatus Omnitrophota bacterium]